MIILSPKRALRNLQDRERKRLTCPYYTALTSPEISIACYAFHREGCIKVYLSRPGYNCVVGIGRTTLQALIQAATLLLYNVNIGQDGYFRMRSQDLVGRILQEAPPATVVRVRTAPADLVTIGDPQPPRRNLDVTTIQQAFLRTLDHNIQEGVMEYSHTFDHNGDGREDGFDRIKKGVLVNVLDVQPVNYLKDGDVSLLLRQYRLNRAPRLNYPDQPLKLLEIPISEPTAENLFYCRHRNGACGLLPGDKLANCNHRKGLANTKYAKAENIIHATMEYASRTNSFPILPAKTILKSEVAKHVDSKKIRAIQNSCPINVMLNTLINDKLTQIKSGFLHRNAMNVSIKNGWGQEMLFTWYLRQKRIWNKRGIKDWLAFLDHLQDGDRADCSDQTSWEARTTTFTQCVALAQDMVHIPTEQLQDDKFNWVFATMASFQACPLAVRGRNMLYECIMRAGATESGNKWTLGKNSDQHAMLVDLFCDTYALYKLGHPPLYDGMYDLFSMLSHQEPHYDDIDELMDDLELMRDCNCVMGDDRIAYATKLTMYYHHWKDLKFGMSTKNKVAPFFVEYDEFGRNFNDAADFLQFNFRRDRSNVYMERPAVRVLAKLIHSSPEGVIPAMASVQMAMYNSNESLYSSLSQLYLMYMNKISGISAEIGNEKMRMYWRTNEEFRHYPEPRFAAPSFQETLAYRAPDMQLMHRTIIKVQQYNIFRCFQDAVIKTVKKQ